jgi:excisionase family DNA binding protein
MSTRGVPEGYSEDGLRTVVEAQEFTRLSRTSLYALMDRGELAFAKIGRRRLIPYRALVELVERGLVIRSGV